MRNVYIVYRLDGAYKYVQSVFSSKEKAFKNLEEVRNEMECERLDVNDQDTNAYNIGGISWTNERSVICSLYVAKEKLR